MNSFFKFILYAALMVQFGAIPFEFRTFYRGSKLTEAQLEPGWLQSVSNEGEDKTNSEVSVIKPLVITAAAGGLVYLIYTVRSK